MSQLNIFHNYKSKNFDYRRKKIDFIILHYTETKTLRKALDLLTTNRRKVSCHYLLSKKGKIYNIVNEDKRAWHAGVSSWNNLDDMNSRSIGIEIVNAGEKSYEIYPKVQITSLIKLIKFLIKKFQIDSHNILGHSDIAPLRKIDPGKFFPWKELNEFNIGLWAKGKKINKKLDPNEYTLLVNNLKRIGYPNLEMKKKKSNSKIINAFHRHYLPELLNKEPTVSSLNKSLELLKKKKS